MAARSLPTEFPIAAAQASVPAHVVYRAFAAETVILNLDTGKYHGLNPTGGRMLELLDRCDSIGDAVVRFANDFGKQPADVEHDVRTFCKQLFERGLIDVRLNGHD